MKQMTYILGGALLMTLALPAQAQKQVNDTTVNRTVVVEQEYNPDIMDATKVNVLPRVEEPAVSKKEVKYDATLMPARNVPAPVMQAFSGKEAREKANPGYARLGYGINGNLDAVADYQFATSENGRLHIGFGMDGADAKLDMGEGVEKWRSFYYRTRAVVDYRHLFRNLELDLAGNFGLSNFNLMPFLSDSKQKFTSGSFHAGIRNKNSELPLDYRIETNLLLYQRQHDPAADGLQETLIRTLGEVGGAISDEQSVNIAFAMDNAFYQKGGFKNVTSIGLNPYYLIDGEDWMLRLGAHVDMAFGFGKQFRAAPDIRAEYTFADSYVLYAQATGGKLQNDFRRLESYTPYSQLGQQLDATYEQLNAALGFKASPTDGLWFNLYGGYQNLRNDVFSLWYSTLTEEELLLTQQHTSNVYAGAEIRYSYKDLFGITASGVYRNWDTSGDSAYGKLEVLAFKPAFEAGLQADVNPIPSVRLSLGYNYVSRTKVDGVQADPVSNLYLHGSYELFKDILLYARLNNLLNQDYQYYEGCPAQGFSLMGGVAFRF